jgi:hypothetical protein
MQLDPEGRSDFSRWRQPPVYTPIMVLPRRGSGVRFLRRSSAPAGGGFVCDAFPVADAHRLISDEPSALQTTNVIFDQKICAAVWDLRMTANFGALQLHRYG